MKNFMYLDTDFLTSFMAQENDGLEVIRNLENNVYSKTTEGTPTTTKTESMNAEANIAVAKGNIGTEKKIESPIHIDESSELYKEVVGRVLHDNVFNYFQNYIDNDFEHCVSQPSKDSVGKYINFKGEFQIFNINALENICNQKFLKELFSFVDDAGKINNISSHIAFTNTNQYKLPNEINNTSILCSKVATIFKTIFPTDTVFIIDNMMIIINKEYLREDIKMINFKYSGEMNVLGVINRIYDSTNNKSTSPFMDVLDSVNVCGIEMINTLCNKESKELYIITPIAIYF